MNYFKRGKNLGRPVWVLRKSPGFQKSVGNSSKAYMKNRDKKTACHASFPWVAKSCPVMTSKRSSSRGLTKNI